MTVAVGIFGILGRLGKTITASAAEDPAIRLIGGLAGPNHQKAENITLYLPEESHIFAQKAAVLIDVSVSTALLSHLRIAKEAQKPIVIGTTGFKAEEFQKIEEAAKKIPILYSSNFSLGMALFRRLAAESAKALSVKKPYIDITEAHHAQKKDAPSGSALTLANTLAPFACHPIGVHSIRAAKIIGEHTVQFRMDEEQIEIKHTVHTRKAFAEGALAAAKFLAKQKPGLYSIDDALGN